MHFLSQLPAFERRGSAPEEVAAHLAACRPGERVRPALISNPMAQTNWRSVAHDRLTRLMPDPLACVSTPSLADLPWALDYVLFQRRANVVVINGGDGTIHHAINAVLTTVAEAGARVGAPVPLPTFLFVNGGGMNMLARAFATRGHPVRTLRRFLQRAGNGRLGDLATREVPLLRVEEADGRAVHGFIFGSELVLNALTMYERFGRGYHGLARFFGEVYAGHVLETELWRRFHHLLDPPTTPLYADDEAIPTYTAVVASTVPMTLLKGLVRTIPKGSAPGRLNAIVVTAQGEGPILATIPWLLAGRQGPGFRVATGLRELRLVGRYTLDGERITRPGGGGDGPLAVRASERVVRGVVLG